VQQRKRKNNPPQTTKKVPFQKHTKQKNKTCENCDPMKLGLSYSKHNNSGRRGHREGERVHLLSAIFVTAPVFQVDTSRLNAVAQENTDERVQQTKRKTKPTTNNKEGTVSKT
jgi:hypothetical protein